MVSLELMLEQHVKNDEMTVVRLVEEVQFIFLNFDKSNGH